MLPRIPRHVLTVPVALMLVAGASIVPAASRLPPPAPRVEIRTVPNAGIQPQAVIDGAGKLHLLYFKGAPEGGDLYYVAQGPGDDGFSSPLRVNSGAGSVLAKGSVRGGQLALGAGGLIHVAWYGAQEVTSGAAKQRPVWYTRMAADRTHFNPQVNVALSSTGIDGATVAADQAGHVWVAWHGQGSVAGEAHRTVYVARSNDGGAHFAPEQPASPPSTGACGCCGLRALTDASGATHILYRSAVGGTSRNATWLTLDRPSREPVVLQTWALDACPMSTFALAQAGAGLAAAWETEQQIYYSRLDPSTRAFSTPVAMDGPAGRKHPSIATSASGVTLVAWTEGTGWARGGTLAWEALDARGARLASQAGAAPVPVWGLVAAVARPDGSFLILR